MEKTQETTVARLSIKTTVFATLLAAAAAQAPMWSVVTGAEYCTVTANAAGVTGACVTDGIGEHGINEACTVSATTDLYATSTYFHTENYYDFVLLNGTWYSGTVGPANAFMNAGQTFAWSSDFSINRGGFVICGSSTPVALPPTVFPPPPSPSPPPPNYTPPPPRPPPPPPKRRQRRRRRRHRRRRHRRFRHLRPRRHLRRRPPRRNRPVTCGSSTRAASIATPPRRPASRWATASRTASATTATRSVAL